MGHRVWDTPGDSFTTHTYDLKNWKRGRRGVGVGRGYWAAAPWVVGSASGGEGGKWR